MLTRAQRDLRPKYCAIGGRRGHRGQTLAHLALLRPAAGPGDELQQGEQEPGAEPQGEQQEGAPQLVGPQGPGAVGPVAGHAAAGPPLLTQVRQLARLTELEDGHGQVLDQRGAWGVREAGQRVTAGSETVTTIKVL